jgi:small subunit ribosomal protein S3Ae
MYTSVKLRVFEIKGKTAYTKFIGHAVSREYLRTLVRRRRDVINLVFSVKSKDDLEFRIKVVVVTNNLCSDPLKTAMRHLVEETLAARARETDFGGFIQDTLYGKVGNEVTAKLRKLASIRRVEISKTTLKEEFDTEEVVGIQKQAGPEGEAAPAEGAAAPMATDEAPQGATHA